MTDFTLLLLIHTAATLFMVGLIWVVQVVHYPLFAHVGAGDFIAYERAHMNRISFIVGPVMLIELASAVLLAAFPPPGVGQALPVFGISLLIVIWASTAAIQAPTHFRLSRSYNLDLIKCLVLGNWLRTILWSVRGILVLAMVQQILAGRMV